MFHRAAINLEDEWTAGIEEILDEFSAKFTEDGDVLAGPETLLERYGDIILGKPDGMHPSVAPVTIMRLRRRSERMDSIRMSRCL